MSNNSDQQIFYPDGIKVKIADREFSIKPFVLKNRQIVVKLFGDVFIEAAKQNQNFAQKMTTGEIVKAVLVVAGDKLVDVYKMVLSDVEEAWLMDNMTIKDEVAVVTAIIEVNDFPFLAGQVENLLKKVKRQQ